MGTPFVPVLLLAAVAALAAADTGPCRYEPGYCSCKIGEAGQGRCWDPIPEAPGTCRRRSCRAGWTCACAGRTHLCSRALQAVSVVEEGDSGAETAACGAEERSLVAGQELELGYLRLSLSHAGVQAGSCTQLTWWHNGQFRGDWPRLSGLSASDADRALAERAEHTLLEVRPGDLFAFRLVAASYYCFKHFAAVGINGLDVTTEMTGVRTHYAREYSPGWFRPEFALNGSRDGLDESETDLRKFLPKRAVMLDNGAEIEPGIDYWAPDGDPGSRDHRVADWFWRIQIPHNVPNSFTF